MHITVLVEMQVQEDEEAPDQDDGGLPEPMFTSYTCLNANSH